MILWDAHSIESVLPSLFEGRLTDLNLGTFDGKSCDTDMAEAAYKAAKTSGFSAVLNARFKGGYITRHYGAPKKASTPSRLGNGAIHLHDRRPTLRATPRPRHQSHRHDPKHDQAVLEVM